MGADWENLSFVFTILGFLLVVLAVAGASHDLTGASGAVEALIICGFLSYLVTFTLTSLVHYGELDNERDVAIANAAFAFFTVLLLIAGLSVYGSKVNNRPPPYTTTLLVCGALMAAMAGIAACLHVTK